MPTEQWGDSLKLCTVHSKPIPHQGAIPDWAWRCRAYGWHIWLRAYIAYGIYGIWPSQQESFTLPALVLLLTSLPFASTLYDPSSDEHCTKMDSFFFVEYIYTSRAHKMQCNLILLTGSCSIFVRLRNPS